MNLYHVCCVLCSWHNVPVGVPAATVRVSMIPRNVSKQITAGLDDESELGKQRIQKSFQLLNKTDIGLLVVEAGKQLSEIEMDLVHRFEK